MNSVDCSYIQLKPYIFVGEEEPSSFVATVQSSLDHLEETGIGKRLIEKIGLTAQSILIEQCEKTGSRPVTTNGTYRGTIVWYSGSGSDDQYLSVDLVPAVRPSFVTLAHELIHAYHNGVGKRASSIGRTDGLVWNDDEEYHTIMGFPSKNPMRNTPKITENALLAELGLPERFSHWTVGAFEQNDIISQRVKLAAEVYNRRCLELNYTGHAHKPPPIINCTAEDLAPSKRVAIYYNTVVSGCPLTRKPVFESLKEDSSLSDDFVRIEIDVNECPSDLQLKNRNPAMADLEVVGMGLFRLSDRETRELDKML